MDKCSITNTDCITLEKHYDFIILQFPGVKGELIPLTSSQGYRKNIISHFNCKPCVKWCCSECSRRTHSSAQLKFSEGD